MKTTKNFSLVVSIFFICLSLFLSSFSRAGGGIQGQPDAQQDQEDGDLGEIVILKQITCPVRGGNLVAKPLEDANEVLDAVPQQLVPAQVQLNLGVTAADNPGEDEADLDAAANQKNIISENNFIQVFQGRNDELEGDSFASIESAFGEIFASEDSKQYLIDIYGDVYVMLVSKPAVKEQEVPIAAPVRVRRQAPAPVVPAVDPNNVIANKKITEITAAEWVKVASGDYGLKILGANGQYSDLFITSDDHNLIDFQIGNAANDTLRKKMKYYGVSADKAKDVDVAASRSMSDFKTDLLAELELVEGQISDLSGFIQSSDMLRSKVQDMKIGIKFNRQDYSIVPMLDSKGSPYMNYFVVKLLQDKRIADKVKKYTSSEALVEVFEFLANKENIESIKDVKFSDFQEALGDAIIDDVPLNYRNDSFVYGARTLSSISAKGKVIQGKNKYAANEGFNDDSLGIGGYLLTSFKDGKKIRGQVQVKVKTVNGRKNVAVSYQGLSAQDMLVAVPVIRAEKNKAMGIKDLEEHVLEYIRRQVLSVDNSKIVDLLENNKIFQETFLSEDHSKISSSDVFDDLKALTFDAAFNQGDDNKEDDGISLLRKQIKLYPLKGKVNDRELDLINLGIEENEKLRIAAWVSEGDVKQYVENNSDALMKLIVADNNFSNSFKNQVNVSSNTDILGKVIGFVSEDDDWFTYDASAFQTNGSGHLISSKGLYDYLKTFADAEGNGASNDKKKSIRYKNFFTAAGVNWLLLDVDGSKKFVYENGNAADQLGEGRKKLIDLIEAQNNGISGDDIEVLVLQNPSFVEQIIIHDAKVKLENFVEAQKLGRSEVIFDDILDNIPIMSSKVVEDYGNLKVEYGNVPEVINVSYMSGNIAKNNPRIMAHIRKFTKKGMHEHPLFNSLGKKVILSSYNSAKIEKIVKSIVSSDKKLLSYVLPVKLNISDNLVTDLASWDNSGNKADQVSVDWLLNNNSFKGLDEYNKANFVGHLVKKSIENRGLFSQDLSRNINFVHLLGYILSDSTVYLDKKYSVNMGVKNIFNSDINVFVGSVNTSFAGKDLGISMGIKGFVSNNSNELLFSSNINGISFNGTVNGFYSLNDNSNGFIESNLNYLKLGNYFSSKDNGRYSLDGSAIFSNTRFSNVFGIVHNIYPSIDLSIRTGLSLGKTKISSYDYDLSEFNKYSVESILGLSANSNFAAFNGNVSGLLRRDLIKGHCILHFDTSIGFIANNFDFRIGFEVNKYNDNDNVYGYSFVAVYQL